MENPIKQLLERGAALMSATRVTSATGRQLRGVLPAFRHQLRQRNVRDRLQGWGVTWAILAMIYVLSAWSDVSPGDYAARVITFTAVTMPAAPSSAAPPAPEPAPAAVEEVVLPTRMAVTLAPSPTLARAALGEARERVTGEGANAPTRSLPNPATLSTPEARAPVSTPGVRRRNTPSGLSTRLSRPQLRPSIEVAPPAVPVTPPEQDVPDARPVIEAPQVRVFDETTLTAEDTRTQAIVEWVIQNPQEIPMVVRSHMDYVEGDHVTRAGITIAGETVDLFLLVRQGYAQLHVLLIQGADSYLFFDRGIRNEASRFRVGEVSHGGGEVLRIVSREREITSDEAQRFYNAFISWWETQSGK